MKYTHQLPSWFHTAINNCTIMDDIKTLPDRLQILIKETGISRNAFAKSIGVSLSTFLGYLKVTGQMPGNIIEKMA